MPSCNPGFDPGYGYHVDKTVNVATGNEPESIYAVFSGKHFNGGCCFVRPQAPGRTPLVFGTSVNQPPHTPHSYSGLRKQRV
jgi:hypothetical protein